MESSLRAGFAMHSWIQRGVAIRGLQIPFDLLVDRWFHETMAASDQRRMQSNVTRISVVLQVGGPARRAWVPPSWNRRVSPPPLTPDDPGPVHDSWARGVIPNEGRYGHITVHQCP